MSSWKFEFEHYPNRYVINILPLDMRVVSFNLNRKQKQIKSDDELYYKGIQTKEYIQKYYGKAGKLELGNFEF